MSLTTRLQEETIKQLRAQVTELEEEAARVAENTETILSEFRGSLMLNWYFVHREPGHTFEFSAAAVESVPTTRAALTIQGDEAGGYRITATAPEAGAAA